MDTKISKKEGETMKYTVFKGKAKDFKGFTEWINSSYTMMALRNRLSK